MITLADRTRQRRTWLRTALPYLAVHCLRDLITCARLACCADGMSSAEYKKRQEILSYRYKLNDLLGGGVAEELGLDVVEPGQARARARA